MSRLDLLMQLNPDFAKALWRRERWAWLRADAVEALDGRGSRRHPERAFKEDGKPVLPQFEISGITSQPVREQRVNGHRGSDG